MQMLYALCVYTRYLESHFILIVFLVLRTYYVVLVLYTIVLRVDGYFTDVFE